VCGHCRGGDDVGYVAIAIGLVRCATGHDPETVTHRGATVLVPNALAGRVCKVKNLHVAGQVAIAAVPAAAVEVSPCDAADVQLVLAGCEVWLMYCGTCWRRAVLGGHRI